MYKIKNGLKNFVFFGYAIVLSIIIFAVWKLSKIIRREYYKSKLAGLSIEEQQELV